MNSLPENLVNAPPEAWLGLIGVFVGAIIAGVISIITVWLTSRANIRHLRVQLAHEKDTKKDTLKREKLEELYILVDKWLTAIFTFYLPLAPVMQGTYDYKEFMKISTDINNRLNVDFTRLEMIIDIYWPSLKPSYEELIKARDELSRIVMEHKNSYLAGNTDGKKFLNPFNQAQLKIESLGISFKEEITKYANNSEEGSIPR